MHISLCSAMSSIMLPSVISTSARIVQQIQYGTVCLKVVRKFQFLVIIKPSFQKAINTLLENMRTLNPV
jgi:glycyl-tRNA synthetase alpha subunit